MLKVRRRRLRTLVLIASLACPVLHAGVWDDWDRWDREDYEESAGGSFALLLNPADEIYGITLGDGTWLKGAPVFGDYFVGVFRNEIEDAAYSNVGMTIRLMPHWTFTPFIGGGSYNYSLSNRNSGDAPFQARNPEELSDRGESYWGGHVEAGLRLWTESRWQLLEIMVRQTWSSLPGDRDYWLVGLSVGAGI